MIVYLNYKHNLWKIQQTYKEKNRISKLTFQITNPNRHLKKYAQLNVFLNSSIWIKSIFNL